MYLRLILFLFLLVSFNHINGQTCYPNGISFSTQNEVDLFRLVNSGCTIIEGSVTLTSGNITNLDSLIDIKKIGGSLNVSTNNLINFTGLNNLDTISEGISINATNLDDFTGLESLKQIGTNDEYSSSAYSSIDSNIEDFTGLDSLQKWYGSIDIHFIDISSFQGLDMLNEIGELNLSDCNNLLNFEGLNSLTKAKSIRVGYCSSFSNSSGANALDTIGELVFSDLPIFTSVEGFASLTDIDYLSIYGCDVLTNLSGFQSIQSIEYTFFLRYNPLLSSIDSLKYADMSELNQLRIHNNSSLSECSIFGTCNYVSEGDGFTIIHSNAPGCNGDTELLEACCSVDPSYCPPSDTCYVSGITFSSQNSVDLFRTVNPGCKVIGGDVSFGSGDITNLDSLIGVEVILGEFNVSTNNMTNFKGLNNLDYISEGISINATNLDDFTGLESLKQIGTNDEYSSSAYSSIDSNIEDFTGLDSLQKWYGSIDIHFIDISSFQGLDMLNEIGELNLSDCNNLLNFEGLNTLTKAKSIRVSNCSSFSNSSGINALDTIGELVFSDLPIFTSVESFTSLTDIDDLSIYGCDVLASLNGFQSIQSIETTLFLRYNPLLSSIDSLKYADMSELNQLRIHNNSSLSECSIFGTCNYVSEGDGFTIIHSNAPGCNGGTELLEACCSVDPSYCPPSDTCYVSGITFSSQNSVDLFRTVNPGCKIIGGDVSFGSGDITNLDSLIGVEVILGELNVSTNNMTNFTGLNNLDYISEGISITATNLDDFTGLESLKQIGTDDEFSSAYSSIDSNIEDFTGLDSLQKWYGSIDINFIDISSFQGLDLLNEIGELTLSDCNSLINFEGLNTLTKAKSIRVSNCSNFSNSLGANALDTIGELEFSDLPIFTSVEGFASLTYIDYLSIDGCDVLASLNGFQSIQSIETILFLRYNPLLSSIDSLKYADMSELNQLRIHNNPLLEVCSIDGICNYLEDDVGLFIIHTNGIGCNGTTEIEYDCAGQLFIFLNGPPSFTGNTSFYWHTASNWRNNQLPGPDSWVIIPPNVNCIVEENTVAECQILDLREGGIITVKDGSILTVYQE